MAWSPGECRASLRTLASLNILKIWRMSSRDPDPSSPSLQWIYLCHKTVTMQSFLVDLGEVVGAGVVVVVVEFELAAELESKKSELKLESRKRETKNGRMERTSTILRESTRKAHFFGAPANLKG